MLTGAALIALAVPRLLASLVTLEARALLPSVPAADGTLNAITLSAAIADTGQALSILDDGDLRIDLASLQQRTRQFSTLPPVPPETVIRNLEQGLALVPAHPKGWALLAEARLNRGDRAGAADALRLSWLTGPVAPDIMLPRLELAMRMRDDFDDSLKAALVRQMQLSWQVDPAALVPAFHRAGQLQVLLTAITDGVLLPSVPASVPVPDGSTRPAPSQAPAQRRP
jgi:hypothetical protein